MADNKLTKKEIQEMINNAASTAIGAACANCEEVAEKAAEKVVNKLGSKVGVNLESEEEVHELKGTIIFGLRQKKSAEKINNAFVGAVVIALVGAAMTGIVSVLKR